MKNEVLYIGYFRLPDRDAGAIRVRGIADALTEAGYSVILVGDNYTGPRGTDQDIPLLMRLPIAAKRGLDRLVTSSSCFEQLELIDWQRVAAVICYPGFAALIWRLMHSCRRHSVPLIIDCVEWFDPSHKLGGRFGPFSLDSEFRMRWLHARAGNVICISSFLTRYYAGKGCNVVRIPPLAGEEMNRYGLDWAHARALSADSLTLVYAGSPGRKELFPEIIEGVQRSRRRGIDVSFKVVGVTEDELSAIMRRKRGQVPDFDGITCYGRMPRAAALQIVAASDYTVILRPQKRFANAGFPSKLVESLSLGVPVIANATSDIAEYLRDEREGYLLSEPTAEALEGAIVRASTLTFEQKSQMRAQARLRAHECFDYRKYAEVLSEFLLSARPCS